MAFSGCLDQILKQGVASEHAGLHMEEPFALNSIDFGLTEWYPQDPEWSVWLESFASFET
ncbi:hypothetical protein BO71DRAFT_402336 [Aspergillus ellipticus CBS 707.79]|uniref:Uncharacterized protein n=1 Tax=Aspergillus ellipticus CBS 707.79 TaxID=1448320 RepID=A0A319CYH1_9EURO|nr:hypothetical protein BO71DRAFT_402336 [Aspergillus ellipticus CBS 707.79]